MRVSIDPNDPGYVGDGATGACEVILNGRFFELGPVITADETAGMLVYAPVVDGIVQTDQNGNWRRCEMRGQVRIFPLSPGRYEVKQ